MAKTLHLVTSDICEAILQAEPIEPFNGDCTTCYLYRPNPPIADGGHCALRGASVGWGFTCREHKNAQKLREKKLEKLKKLNEAVLYK